MKTKIFSILITAAFFFLFSFSVFSEEMNPEIFVKRFPQTYHVEIKMSPKKNTLKFKEGTHYVQKLYVPIPISNQYHTVSNIKTTLGEIKKFKNSGENYLYVESNKPIPAFDISFDIEVYDIVVDWSKIKKIYPYDKNSQLYQQYTKHENDLINPENQRIKIISHGIWKESSNVLDYARRIYAYEQKLLKWMDVRDSTVDTIFARKAGDCGGLSSVLVSLLRAKGIPSRYMSGGVITKDGKLDNHIWAEFYLEKYGWFPVDAAYFGGETLPYFGYESNNRLFYIRGSAFETEEDDKIQFLQTWAFYHFYSNGGMSGDYELQKDVSITVTQESDKAKVLRSADNIKSMKEKLLALINQERENKGAAPLKITPKTDEIAKIMVEAQKNKKSLKLTDVMKNKGYSIYSYGNFYYNIGATGLYQEKQIFDGVKNNITGENFKEIGIGIQYLADSDQFLYYLFIAEPKE